LTVEPAGGDSRPHVGCLLCLTIIGIPLGVGAFKMAGAALVPFGKQVVLTRDLRHVPPDAVGPAI
jgi:uncharacterized membrane protein YccF (DUF307 family)